VKSFFPTIIFLVILVMESLISPFLALSSESSFLLPGPDAAQREILSSSSTTSVNEITRKDAAKIIVASASGILDCFQMKLDIPTWTITLASNNEITSSNVLEEQTLLYAEKNYHGVTVTRRNLKDGATENIFDYDEAYPATYSDCGLNVSISPDNRTLSFVDQEGLKLYDCISNKVRNMLIGTYIPSENDCDGIRWFNERLGSDVFRISNPLWSFDGKYICFSEGYYEGGGLGVIEANNLDCDRVDLDGVSPKWSPKENALLETCNSVAYGRDWGLIYCPEKKFSHGTNIGNKYESSMASQAPYIDLHGFVDANFSHDGEMIAFLFKLYVYNIDCLDHTNPTFLGYIMKSTGDYTYIGRSCSIETPFFSKDDQHLYFVAKVEGHRCLFRYNIVTRTIYPLAVLPDDYDAWKHIAWTKSGYLCLFGISKDTSRLIIVDINTHVLIYASPVLTSFLTILSIR